MNTNYKRPKNSITHIPMLSEKKKANKRKKKRGPTSGVPLSISVKSKWDKHLFVEAACCAALHSEEGWILSCTSFSPPDLQTFLFSRHRAVGSTSSDKT
jgi:hypothetical protein